MRSMAILINSLLKKTAFVKGISQRFTVSPKFSRGHIRRGRRIPCIMGKGKEGAVMRTRFRRRLLLKKILTALFLAVSIPAAAGFLLWTMPDISGYAVRAGLLSAGFALPEGGLAFLQSRGASEESAEPAVSAVPVREEASEPVSEPEASAPEESSLPEEPAESLPAEDPEVPEEYQAALVHKTFTTAPSNIYIPLKNGYIKNCTSVSREEILRQVQELPGFTVEDTEEPQVLIMHTHATETFTTAAPPSGPPTTAGTWPWWGTASPKNWRPPGSGPSTM